MRLPNTQDITLGILRELERVFTTQSSNSFIMLFLYKPRPPLYNGEPLTSCKKREQEVLHVHKSKGRPKSSRQKLKSAFSFLSATFPFTMVNFKQLYLVAFSLKLGAINHGGKLRKSSFTCLKLLAI